MSRKKHATPVLSASMSVEEICRHRRAYPRGVERRRAREAQGPVDTVALVQAQLQTKDASIERLRHMIFGATTESTRNVLGQKRGEPPAAGSTRRRPPHDRSRPVMGAMPPPRTPAQSR